VDRSAKDSEPAEAEKNVNSTPVGKKRQRVGNGGKKQHTRLVFYEVGTTGDGEKYHRQVSGKIGEWAV